MSDNSATKNTDNFDKKEAIHEHLNDSVRIDILEHDRSAFSKYVSQQNITGTSSTSENMKIPLSFADNIPNVSGDISEHTNANQCESSTAEEKDETSSETKPAETDTSSELKPSTSLLVSLWKNDLTMYAGQWDSDIGPQRPRTWSEGCRMRATKRFAKDPRNLAVDAGEEANNTLACSLVNKIRSQFGQLFLDSTNSFRTGCCLTPGLPASSTAGQLKQASSVVYGRTRHYSDDRHFSYSSAKNDSHTEVSYTSDKANKAPESNLPPATCAGADNPFPSAMKIPRTGVECPF